MMKRSYLTPILSGVLAVTVVGSGAAYYFEFVKDGGSGDDAKSGKGSNTQMTVGQAADDIEQQLDKARQIANGDYTGAYKAEITYTPGAGITDDLGMEIAPISASVEARQKDKLTGMDYDIKYDSQTVISANVVYDNANETGYVQIPEFSDAYITGTMTDVENMMSDSLSSAYTLDDSLEASSFSADPVTASPSQPDLDALADIDFDALFDDIESYWDIVKENAPAPTDGANKTGEVDGAGYELTTKTYTVTVDDARKIAQAVSDKAKTDETLKKALIGMGMTESDYDAMWSELTDSMNEQSDEKLIVEAYYNGEDFAGFSFVPEPNEDNEKIQIINYMTDSQMIMDWDMVMEDETMTAKGLITLDGNVMNGSVKMDVNEYGETSNMTLTYDSLEINDDSIKGGISLVLTEDGTESAKISMTLNNTADSLDMTMEMAGDGVSLGTVNLTAQETDASDITIPTGTMYSISDDAQMEQYANSIDADGWVANLQTILGDELYNAIFGVDYFGEDDYDYDYDDYGLDDYDLDDYDFDDYDFEDYDLDDYLSDDHDSHHDDII